MQQQSSAAQDASWSTVCDQLVRDTSNGRRGTVNLDLCFQLCRDSQKRINQISLWLAKQAELLANEPGLFVYMDASAYGLAEDVFRQFRHRQYPTITRIPAYLAFRYASQLPMLQSYSCTLGADDFDCLPHFEHLTRLSITINRLSDFHKRSSLMSIHKLVHLTHISIVCTDKRQTIADDIWQFLGSCISRELFEYVCLKGSDVTWPWERLMDTFQLHTRLQIIMTSRNNPPSMTQVQQLQHMHPTLRIIQPLPTASCPTHFPRLIGPFPLHDDNMTRFTFDPLLADVQHTMLIVLRLWYQQLHDHPLKDAILQRNGLPLVLLLADYHDGVCNHELDRLVSHLCTEAHVHGPFECLTQLQQQRKHGKRERYVSLDKSIVSIYDMFQNDLRTSTTFARLCQLVECKYVADH